MPFGVRVLPRVEYALHKAGGFARAHKWVLIAAVALALLATVWLAHGQAVSRTGQAQLRLEAVADVRATNPLFDSSFTPFWHFLSVPTDPILDTVGLTRAVAFTYSLSDRASISELALNGTLSFSVVSGSLPTGVTLQTNVTCPDVVTAYCLKGTPTTVQTVTPTIRVTFTPDVGSATTADQAFTMTVVDPDSLAPSVPTNVVVAPVSSTSLSVSWTASIDASGILNYDLSYATSEASCTNSDLNVETDANPPNTLSGLVAGTTYWVKLRARDNSVAQNVSAWTTCVSGTTLGGGGGTPLIFDEGFETVTIPTDNNDGTHPLFRASHSATDANNLTAVSTTHAREGVKSLRTKLTRSGTTNFRQELTVKTSLSTTAMAGSSEYWEGLSVYIPSTSSLVTGSVIWQWHTWGSICCSPVWGLRVLNGNYSLTQEGTSSNASIGLGAVATNEWIDWVIRIKWRADGTGLIQVWKNGTLVVDRLNDQTGPTLVPSDINSTYIPFFKFGRYTGLWQNSGGDANGTVHESWHDAQRICYSNACVYADVAPRGNRLTAP